MKKESQLSLIRHTVKTTHELSGVKFIQQLGIPRSLNQHGSGDPPTVLHFDTIQPTKSLVVAAIVSSISTPRTDRPQLRDYDGKEMLPAKRVRSLPLSPNLLEGVSRLLWRIRLDRAGEGCNRKSDRFACAAELWRRDIYKLVRSRGRRLGVIVVGPFDLGFIIDERHVASPFLRQIGQSLIRLGK